MSGLKKFIKKIPVIGTIITRMYRALKGSPEFTSSKEYWEKRYQKGGSSGAGSYNRLAEFKAQVINDFVTEKDIKSVIEFGSGDGNQLKYFRFDSYTGFDVSRAAIDKCRSLYEGDRSKTFKVLHEYNNEKADLVLSLDVIYHLIEEAVFHEHLETLFRSSEQYVIIYSSNMDDHEDNQKSEHVKHRNFTNWVQKHMPAFKLIKHIPNKYPFNGDNEISSYADFYIFEAQPSTEPV